MFAINNTIILEVKPISQKAYAYWYKSGYISLKKSSMSDLSVISCAELLARRFLPPSAKLQMSDDQSCHVRHSIRACFGVSCSCLDTSDSSICLEIIIYEPRMFIQSHKTTEPNFTCPRLFSKAKFTWFPAAIGFLFWFFPALTSSLWLVIVGSFLSKISYQITFLSFWGGWSGLNDSFVLFGPQNPKAVVTSYAWKFSDDFIICDTDKENRSSIPLCFSRCLF